MHQRHEIINNVKMYKCDFCTMKMKNPTGLSEFMCGPEDYSNLRNVGRLTPYECNNFSVFGISDAFVGMFSIAPACTMLILLKPLLKSLIANTWPFCFLFPFFAIWVSISYFLGRRI